jgi:hypothetical protein
VAWLVLAKFLTHSWWWWWVTVRAHVGVAVTDDTVLEMVQRREQAPRLPAMAVFESDVAHLEDAHVYLDPAHPLSEVPDHHFPPYFLPFFFIIHHFL